MRIPLTCKICKKIFLVKKYREKTAKCCSRKCLWYFTKPIREPKRLKKIKNKRPWNFKKIQIKCKKCCKKILISPSRLKIRKYCSRFCYSKDIKISNKKRYLFININKKRFLFHRFIMENFLNRKLLKREHIHHIDGNKHNNDISNLQVIDIVEHAKLHALQKKTTYFF